MGKTFTYSYPTRICYSEQIDEFCEDMDSFDYEVSDEKIKHALAVMMFESEFEKYSVLEDKEIKKFTRDELQQSAPETNDGYWQVPRLVK